MTLTVKGEMIHKVARQQPSCRILICSILICNRINRPLSGTFLFAGRGRQKLRVSGILCQELGTSLAGSEAGQGQQFRCTTHN